MDDCKGRSVAGMSHQEAIITGVLSAGVLESYRRDFPAWMDADGEMVAAREAGTFEETRGTGL